MQVKVPYWGDYIYLKFMCALPYKGPQRYFSALQHEVHIDDGRYGHYNAVLTDLWLLMSDWMQVHES
jgi:hypothetical protein